MKANRVVVGGLGIVFFVGISSVWAAGGGASAGKSSSKSTASRSGTSSTSSASGNSRNHGKTKSAAPSPPPPLVAHLINTKSQQLGTAVYTQAIDKTGQVTGRVLAVQVTPLPDSLVGTAVNITVDSVVVGTVKVVKGSGKSPASAQLTLDSKLKDKVPSITAGSLFQVGKQSSPIIGQGTFMVLPGSTTSQ